MNRQMSRQEIGPIGRAVGAMIRRNLKKNFHTLYWSPPDQPLKAPVLFACNHHGWHDGYVMFAVAEKLDLPCYAWIERYDAFPLFKYIHGLPYRRGKATERATTIRQTQKGMNSKGMSAALFPEAILHPGPDVRKFGEAITELAKAVPDLSLVPTAIHYRKDIHERPEAFVKFAQPLSAKFRDAKNARDVVESLLTDMRSDPDLRKRMSVLMHGTKDVDERWGSKLEQRRRERP